MAVIDTLTVNLAAQTAGLTKGLKSAEGAIGSFSKNATKALAGFGAAFAAAFSISKVTSFVKSGLDFADEISDTAARLQITAESLNQLRHAAELNDVPFETLTMGMERLAKTLGVAPDKALHQFADEISRMPNKFERAKAATEVFGKSGIKLIPLLNQGSAGLTKLGSEVAGLFSPERLKKFDEANDAIRDLGEAFNTLKLQVLPDLAPAIKSIATEMKSILESYRALRGIVGGEADIGPANGPNKGAGLGQPGDTGSFLAHFAKALILDAQAVGAKILGLGPQASEKFARATEEDNKAVQALLRSIGGTLTSILEKTGFSEPAEL
jgi:hypothetical protein